MKNTTTPKDEELIVAYKNGDNKAFEIFYKRHRNLVIRVSQRIVFDYEVAQDISQEAFLKFINSINSKALPEQKYFLSFLATIATNLSIDFLRKKRNLTFFSLDTLAVSQNSDSKNNYNPGDYISANDLSALDKIIKEEENTLLWRAVENLPYIQKVTLRQKYYYGLKFEEIALFLGGPCITWRIRSHRAILKLKDKFSEF